MTPVSHPGDEWLVSHGAGTCGEAISLLVATHLSFCAVCRGKVAEAEAVGGALLSRLPPAMLARSIESAIANLRDDDRVAPPTPMTRQQNSAVPEPLRSYVGEELSGGWWIPVAPGFSYRAVLTRQNMRVRLLRCKPGAELAQHSHRGSELTLVLSGSFRDATGHFAIGDVQTATPELSHAPIADEDAGCICLMVSDAPLQFAGRAARVLTKLSGF